jgi:diaminopimelate decarboxylase/aspartate kinase
VNDRWVVLKFGGTSVTGLKQWESIATLIRERLDDGNRVLLVCSALSGVTNALLNMAASAGVARDSAVTALLDRHRLLARELNINVTGLLRQADREISDLLDLIKVAPDQSARYSALASLISVGEWLSTRMGEFYLSLDLQVQWVDARDALTAEQEPDQSGKRSRLSARCNSGPDNILERDWSARARVLICQGYVASHPFGGTALLGRGGSDTSAALLASRLSAKHVEIWTDVPGLFSADPRVIPSARLLRYLNYDEALEMAASGAKVVHARCIRAAADAGIPILVRDLTNRGNAGTTICRGPGSTVHLSQGIRAVCCQSDMAVLLLQNLDTREHIGFLAWVFTQISEAGVSIDLVATSETTTTVALDRIRNHLDEEMLKALADRLEDRCRVTVFSECSAINLVGRGVRTALADIDPGSEFFSKHALLMLSQSANDMCISILLHSQDAEALLFTLHDNLIVTALDETRTNDIYGPSWNEIRDGQ